MTENIQQVVVFYTVMTFQGMKVQIDKAAVDKT